MDVSAYGYEHHFVTIDPRLEGLGAVCVEGARLCDIDLVQVYLKDIANYPLLTAADEQWLARAIEAGDAAQVELEKLSATLCESGQQELLRQKEDGIVAFKKFVRSNLRLVVSVAKKYQNRGLPLLDLIQEGNLGLMNSVEKFDHRKGYRFSTYATWGIRESILAGLADTSRTIRLPVHVHNSYARIQKARSGLVAELGREPSSAEIAGKVDSTAARVDEVLKHAAAPTSFSAPAGEYGDAQFGDFIYDADARSPLEEALTNLLPAQVAEMLDILEPLEKEVLRLRFGLDQGEPRTLQDVGELLTIKWERVRRIEKLALSKLRQPLHFIRSPH